MSTTNNSSSGIGLCGMVFVVFLTLKLTEVIDWSWWWITAPLWGGLVLAAAVCVVFLLGVVVVASIMKITGK